ncbi:GAB3 [Acrasis kona]|uniref:GAB3 n=1 Tax=Acrasis kona TaxID=1008807 RepID=A0AAW2Z7D2_9EUKA
MSCGLDSEFEFLATADEDSSSTPNPGPYAGDTNKQGLPACIHNVFKTGSLLKRGKWNKNFLKRWFVLRDGTLSYYQNNNTRRPIRVIDLKDTFVRKAPEIVAPDVKTSACFMLFTKERNFYFAADNSVQMNEWIISLRMAGAILDPDRPIVKNTEEGVFDEEAAKELLFEKLKFQSKNATAQNDAYLEEVLSNHDFEKKQKLIDLEQQLREEFRITLDEKEQEISSTLKSLHETNLEKERLLRMSFVERESELQRQIHQLTSTIKKNQQASQKESDERIKTATQFYTNVINDLNQRISTLEALTTSQQSESHYTDEYVQSLTLQVTKLQNQIEVLKIKSKSEMEGLMRRLQMEHDMRVLEIEKQHKINISRLEKDQRVQLADNAASLTIELGKAIYNKDKELIRIKFGKGLSDSEGVDPNDDLCSPITPHSQSISRSLADFHSGTALREAVRIIEEHAVQVQNLEVSLSKANFEKEQLEQSLNFLKEKDETLVKQVDTLRDNLIKEREEIEKEVSEEKQNEIKQLRELIAKECTDAEHLRYTLKTLHQEKQEYDGKYKKMYNTLQNKVQEQSAQINTYESKILSMEQELNNMKSVDEDIRAKAADGSRAFRRSTLIFSVAKNV